MNFKFDDYSFLIDSELNTTYFAELEHKNPFHLNAELKTYIKSLKCQINIEDIKVELALEIQVTLKNTSKIIKLYEAKNNYKICIIKFRMADDKSNLGKSSGWRIIALMDDNNKIFYLLSIYKHSLGKDNITKDEKNKLKALCDDYSNNI